jgi:hypothetical protein
MTRRGAAGKCPNLLPAMVLSGNLRLRYIVVDHLKTWFLNLRHRNRTEKKYPRRRRACHPALGVAPCRGKYFFLMGNSGRKTGIRVQKAEAYPYGR